jgi:hypothetical protein
MLGFYKISTLLIRFTVWRIGVFFFTDNSARCTLDKNSGPSNERIESHDQHTDGDLFDL